LASNMYAPFSGAKNNLRRRLSRKNKLLTASPVCIKLILKSPEVRLELFGIFYSGLYFLNPDRTPIPPGTRRERVF